MFGAAKAERAIDSTASVNQVEANAHMTRKGYRGVEREGGRERYRYRCADENLYKPDNAPNACPEIMHTVTPRFNRQVIDIRPSHEIP